jgi:streptogrisin D
VERTATRRHHPCNCARAPHRYRGRQERAVLTGRVGGCGGRHPRAHTSQSRGASAQRAGSRGRKRPSGLTVAVDADVDVDNIRVPTTPVPVKVVKQPRLRLTSGSSRLADTPPFWGGARIISEYDGSECTVGFPMIHYSNESKWLLTAGHCAEPGPAGVAYFNGNRTWYVGTALYENDYDLMLIWDRNANAGGRIWVADGPSTPWPVRPRFIPDCDRPDPPPICDPDPDPPPPPPREWGLPLAGSGATYKGEYLCHSGSVSGTICGLQNTGVKMSATVYDPGCRCSKFLLDLELARRVDGRLAADYGDSGGPVFAPYLYNGEWRIVAKGIISGTAGPIGGGTHDTLVFQDVWTAFDQWGVGPISGP